MIAKPQATVLDKNAHNLTGRKFGRLTVGNAIRKNKALYWECNCECGEMRLVLPGNLTSGRQVSCGCLRNQRTRERSVTHGARRTRLYGIWTDMLQRCRNPDRNSYPRYGGRGISVCERWLTFENFREDMGDPPRGKSLDRVDNDGNYEPSNCRWATATEQVLNRSVKRMLTYRGETLHLSEMAKKHGLTTQNLWTRLNDGWTLERAIEQPKRKRGCHANS